MELFNILSEENYRVEKPLKIKTKKRNDPRAQTGTDTKNAGQSRIQAGHITIDYGPHYQGGRTTTKIRSVQNGGYP